MGILIPIEKLSFLERIQVMEDLWDSLSHEKKELDSPDWHRSILEDRRKKIESGTARLLTIDDLKKQFRK